MGGQLRDNLEGEGVGVELLELIEISAGRYKQCFFFSIPSIKPNLVGTWCQLDPFLPGRVRFLHQTTELCAAEWSTRARQLYIKPFVHYQHSRVFPVYASRGDGDDVWRATAALNNLAALSQNKLTVQWMQRDVQIILKLINFFSFLGEAGCSLDQYLPSDFSSFHFRGGKKILVLMEDRKGSKQGPLFARWLIRWDGAKNNISGLFGPQLSRKNGG